MLPDTQTSDVFVKIVNDNTLREWTRDKKVGELPLEFTENASGINPKYMAADVVLGFNNTAIVPTKKLIHMLKSEKEPAPSPLDNARNTPHTEDSFAIVYVRAGAGNKLMFDHAAIGSISENHQEFVVNKVQTGQTASQINRQDPKIIALTIAGGAIGNQSQAENALSELAQLSATHEITKTALKAPLITHPEKTEYGLLINTDGPSSGPNLPPSAQGPRPKTR